MTRHCVLAIAVALLCTLTAVVLAEAGVFDAVGGWLFERYAAESLLKPAEPATWGWLGPAVAVLVSLVVAWVAVDAVPWSTRTVVFLVTALVAAFLSLTLALYGIAYNPVGAVLAATLAWVMGGLVAETPAGRRQREWQRVMGGRVASATLAEWVKTGASPSMDGEVREAAVLAVRVLGPLPVAARAEVQLSSVRRVIREAAGFLQARGGVVLDGPSGDGVRAFFGLGPEGAARGPEAAATAALALSGFLKEETTLAAQAGRPVVACGVGVSFGSLLCGNHGTEDPPFWTATGPAAEQARQLAALNARHGTRILVGRRLAERLRDGFELRLIDGETVQTLVAAKVEMPADDPVPDSAEPELVDLPPAESKGAGEQPIKAAAPLETESASAESAESAVGPAGRRKRHRPGGSAE